MNSGKLKTFFESYGLPVLVFLGGFIFIAAGLRLYNGHRSFLPVTAEIVDIQSYYDGGEENDRHYDVTVAYTVDGTAYSELLDEYRSSFRVGNTVEILYNPENPREIQSKSLLGMFIEFGFGALAVLGGAGWLIRNIRKAQNAASA